MLRALSLALIAAAAPVAACKAAAEPPASPCAPLRLMAGWACVEDPDAPGGYRLERTRALAEPAAMPACAAAWCVMVRPLVPDAPEGRGRAQG